MNFIQGTEEDAYQLTVDGDKDALVRLLQVNPSVSIDYQHNDEYSALMVACGSGRIDIARALLDAGANVNSVSRMHGVSAFSRACAHGHLELVKVLMNEYTANVNVQNKVGCTVLMNAASAGSTELVGLLLACDRIEISLKNEAGHTALQVAKNDEIKSLLKTFAERKLAQSATSPNTRKLPTDKLDSFKVQYRLLAQQVPGIIPRADWLQHRDDLQSRFHSAQTASDFVECARLGRELQACIDSAAQLILSETDLLTLPARRENLHRELQAFCHALVGSMDYECLEEAAVLLEALSTLDAQALAVAEQRAALAAAAAAMAEQVINTDNNSPNQVSSLQRTISELKSDLAERDAKIDALSAELSKLRASPITWIDEGPADTYETPRPKHRDSYIAEDFRWL